MIIATLIICVCVVSSFAFFAFSDDAEKLRHLVFRSFNKDKYSSKNMDKLLETIKRNSISFKISQGKPVLAAGQSKFGGMPDVPKDFEWPKTKSGLPLSFLAQINCAEITSLDHEKILPSSGIFYFFCELSDMEWEVSGNDSFVRILYYNTESQREFSPHPFSDKLAKENRLPEYALDFESAANYPSTCEDLEVIFHDREQIQVASTDKYNAILDDIFKEMESKQHNGRMLGYAEVIQNSMLGNNPDPANAVLLFQLNSCDTPDGFSLMFGDCGNLYFYIQREDLSRLDFSRISFEAQCY